MTTTAKTGYTPGPWRTVSDHREGERLCIESVTDEETQGEWSGRRIAIIGSSLAEFKANAALISAAPELLEALKAAHESLREKYGIIVVPRQRSLSECFEELRRFEAAIRKAEGQP